MNAASLQAATDRALVGKRTATRHVLVSLVAPEGAPLERPPVNLGLALDRSGSMSGDKIRLSRTAAVAALRRLGPNDRFSVVAFDDVVTVVVPATDATSASVAAAARAVLGIEARGSTDLAGGWQRACEGVAGAARPGMVNRVVMLTDGLANVGLVDPLQIAAQVAEARRCRIATSTLGVGYDFDEQLLGRMADEGGGHFYYVERDEQIPGAIETEVGEALEVTVPRAVLAFSPAATAEVRAVGPYPAHREGDRWLIELGDLVSLQELQVPVRISFARGAMGGAAGSPVELTIALEGGGGVAASTHVRWTLAEGAAVAAQPRARVVDRGVGEAYAAMARREAGRLNRMGDYRAAQRHLEAVARRVRRYAGRDRALNDLVRDLERDAAEHAIQMSAADLKSRYMTSEMALKHRLMSGGSSRGSGRPSQ